MAGRTLGVADAEPTFDKLTVTGDVALGDAAGDLIAFHGATAVDQAAAQTCLSTSAPITSCGVYGFTTTQASGILTNINAILDLLKEKGLMAT